MLSIEREVKDKDFSTRSVRAGQTRSHHGEHSPAIFATSSFVFENAQQAADRFAESEKGNIYSRFTNPTVQAFEERLANLEGAEYCRATASGMSAILSLCMSTLKSGDQILASRGLFGSTISLFSRILNKFGIETEFLSPLELDLWEQKLQTNTKLIFVETPSNPLCEIVDINKLSIICKYNKQCKLVVDNAFCTPALQRPLELGADVVVHSATKFLDGHGRGIGGAVCTNDKALADDLFAFNRTAGPSMSPFNAWIFNSGLETLELRMNQSSRTAGSVARWLNSHPNVARVFYPGLENHVGHDLAKQQQSEFGPIVGFEVKGERKEAWHVIDSTSLLSITANLGDVKTTITHPTTTTHKRITAEEREIAGIKEGLIRLSIGLESTADIINDLDAGLSTLP